MTDVRASSSDLKKGIKLAIGGRSKVTVLQVRRVRITGMFFDLNKCFMLPSAVPGIKRVAAQYKQHPDSNMLIVGHTDTSGQDADNLTLSLERADAIAAYLTDNAAAWDAFFGTGKTEEKRWGNLEIEHMLSVLPDEDDRSKAFFQGVPDGKSDEPTKAAIRAFQTAESLSPANGTLDPATRKRIIEKYMAIVGTSVPGGITITTHGAGESFPAVETKDSVRSADDRRAEFFLFDGPITPPPPGKTSKRGSKEYPQWLAQVENTVDVSADSAAAAKAGPFRYGVPVGPGSPWTAQAVLRIRSEDGSDERVFAMALGAAEGAYRVFDFPDSKPGLKYNGFMEQGESKIAVFGPVELRRLSDPFDDVNELPLPPAPPAPVEKDEDPAGPDTATGPDPAVADPVAVAQASEDTGTAAVA